MFRRSAFFTGLALALALFPSVTAAKDWTHHTGKVRFTVGYEKGLKKAKAQGKPMMLYFTTTW